MKSKGLFSLAYSGLFLLLQKSGWENIQYNAHGHDTIYPVIISGVLICVVNKHQINDFHRILAKYDNTFSYYEQVNETYGNFKRIK